MNCVNQSAARIEAYYSLFRISSKHKIEGGFAFSSGACAPAASSATAFRSLGQNLSKQRVVLIFIHMVDTNVPATIILVKELNPAIELTHL